jgi:hypothetical protein
MTLHFLIRWQVNNVGLAFFFIKVSHVMGRRLVAREQSESCRRERPDSAPVYPCQHCGVGRNRAVAIFIDDSRLCLSFATSVA